MQVVEARRFLAAEGDATPLTNLVYMGMVCACIMIKAPSPKGLACLQPGAFVAPPFLGSLQTPLDPPKSAAG